MRKILAALLAAFVVMLAIPGAAQANTGVMNYSEWSWAQKSTGAHPKAGTPRIDEENHCGCTGTVTDHGTEGSGGNFPGQDWREVTYTGPVDGNDRDSVVLNYIQGDEGTWRVYAGTYCFNGSGCLFL